MIIALFTSIALFLSLPIATVFAQGQSFQIATQTFSVPATAGDASPPTTWFDTGFDLKAGNPINVTASGTAQFCPTAGPVFGGCSTTPDGPIVNPNNPPPNPFPPGGCAPGGAGAPLCTANIGALIAVVGNGPAVLVGSGPTTLSGVGRLIFAYNDGYGDHYDNSGQYSVTITYLCQPGNGIGDQNHYHCGP